jgi:hypothetical protein
MVSSHRACHLAKLFNSTWRLAGQRCVLLAATYEFGEDDGRRLPDRPRLRPSDRASITSR